MTFGDKVRAARERQGLSQAELARKMNVSQQAIAKYEKIINTPKLVTIRKIASALDLPLSELVNDWEQFTPQEIADDFKQMSTNVSNGTKELADIATKTIIDMSNTINESIADTEEKILLYHYHNLNTLGQDKAIEQVELLTKIPEYQKKVEAEPEVEAAHARTDITTTEEMKKHDDDIMNDSDF